MHVSCGPRSRWFALTLSVALLTSMHAARVGADTYPLMIGPVNPTVAPRGRVAFAAGGGDGGYRFELVEPHGGMIAAAYGSYIAGPQGDVTETVRVSDTAGNSVTTTITVSAGVSVSPDHSDVPPRGSLSLSASGGSSTGYQYALSSNNSGGSVDAMLGVYTAGITGNVLDEVTVTDSLGNSATALLQVTGPVQLTAPAFTLAPGANTTVRATHGSGSGFVFALSVDASGATLDPNTGAYIAGPKGNVIDVIRATDSLGNIGFIALAITGSVTLAPATANVAPEGKLTFAASGGSGSGFRYSLGSNASGATIDATSGAYTAGSLGDVNDVIQVEDSLGNHASASVAVGASVTISPSSVDLAPRATRTFTAGAGSMMGLRFTLQEPAHGTIDADSGKYTAGTRGELTDTVIVTDSLGSTARATVQIGAGLALTPYDSTLAPLGRIAFAVTGGSGSDFTYRLSTNGSMGGIDTHAGVYQAGGYGQTNDVVTVQDSLGNTATATITVTAALAVTPQMANVPTRGSYDIIARGGAAPYRFALIVNGSAGSVDSTTGEYNAGTTQESADKIVVTDANGASAVAMMQIGARLSLSAAQTSVMPSGTTTVAAQGGSSYGYTYSLKVDASGGHVDAVSGAYTAGVKPNTVDVITVKDSLNNGADLAIAVGGGVALNPPTQTVAPRDSQAFFAAGGSSTGFSFAFVNNASGGTLDALTGLYKAGPKGGGSDLIRVRDSLANIAEAVIIVGQSVTLSPASLALPPNASQAFGVSGGSGAGYVFSLPTRASGAVIDANGNYQAGATGNTRDVVRVADSLGNTAEVTVNVGRSLTLGPDNTTVPPRGSVTLIPEGGSAVGYSFAVTSNAAGGSVVASTGQYTAGTKPDSSDVIEVSDSLGNTAQLTIMVGPGITLEPSSADVAPGSTFTIAAHGGSGQFVYTLTDDESGSTLDQDTGLYTAGPRQDSTDVITVTDTLGNSAVLNVAVGGGFHVEPRTVALPPGGLQLVQASGGVGTNYRFELTTNGSNGSVSASGTYTAGPTGDSRDVVTVSDEGGNRLDVEIAIGPSISLSPLETRLAPRGHLQLMAAGGDGTFSFAFASNASSGKVNAKTGLYEAGYVGDTEDTIIVTDALGNSATAKINISTVLALVQAGFTTPPRGHLKLEAMGGAAGYSYEFVTNPSGAMLDAASGEYIAGAIGSVDDKINVRDQNGVTRTATIMVGSEITISPHVDSVALGASLQLSATGGSGQVYAWQLESAGAGSIDATTGLYDSSGGHLDDTVVIAVRDELGNEAKLTFVLNALAAPPKTSGGGCSVSPRGATTVEWPWSWALLAAAGALRLRRRQRPLAPERAASASASTTTRIRGAPRVSARMIA